MPSRRHGSVASTTPARARQRNDDASTTPAAAGAAAPARATQFALPPYEPPAAPLTADSRQALSAILTRSCPLNKINEHLKRASAALEESTSDINERLTDRDAIVKRRKAKRARNDAEDAELDEKENADLAAMRSKVEAMTARLDLAMRKCVDGETGLEHLEKTLAELSRSAANAVQTASQLQSSQYQQQQQRSTGSEADDTNDAAAGTPEVTQPGTAPAPTPSAPQPPPSLTPAFTSTLQARGDAYAALSLRTRYAQHQAYVSFKKLTWDAQHPSDAAPPMPHASTWFAAEEAEQRRRGAAASPAPGETGGGRNDADAEAADADADELAVARVRISTRCPLTLLEFVDPVTATPCGHSFERAAIGEMLGAQRPPTRRGGGTVAGWAPRVQCPVAGCSAEIGREDLVADRVVAQRVRRVQRAREMAALAGASDAVEPGEGVWDGTMVVDDEEEEEEDGGVDEVEDDVEEAKEERNSQAPRRRGARRAVSDEIEDDD